MGTLHTITPPVPQGPPGKPQLRPATRLDVEQAREFLAELDGRMAGADLPRLAYLVGLLDGHARNLLDAIDAVTVPGGET